MTLLLVTAPDCHLCAHARTVLAQLAVDAREVDLDSEEARGLREQGLPPFLPVLTDGKVVIAYGRLSERRLRKDLGL